MTARSRRRRAEMNLIDAAIAHCKKYADEWWAATDDALDLYRAVQEYEALGLQALGPAEPGKRDTSAAAAASLTDVSGEALVCFNEIVAAGGLTVDQLEVILRRPHQSVSARVNDLVRKGWIVESGMKRKTRSGRQAIVWVPSELARKEAPT